MVLPNIIRVIKPRRMRWVGHVACNGERKGAYRAVVGRPEAQRPRVRPRHRWEDNIKTDFKEGGWKAYSGVMWLKRRTGGGHL